MSPAVRASAAFALALAVTYLLTPLVIRLAFRTEIVKRPGGRHAHAQPTPLLGGLALFAGTVVAGVAFALDWPVVITVSLALFAGLVDDYCKCRTTELPAFPKLLLQLLPAALWVTVGNTIHYISNPFGHDVVMLPWWLDYPLSMAWLIGMTNALNFLDGMDGLAAGTVSIAAFSLSIIALMQGAGDTAVWVAAMGGACLAFLRYNFHPAKVFMGDAGSNFLGFLLAALSISGYFKTATLTGLAAPLITLSIPLLNVGFVVVRRMRQGKSFYQALTHGDLEHSFNVLNRSTRLNHKETVLVFFMACILCSGLGIVLVSP